ncbi:MAG TPA: ABC transporter ATP-binding protein [Blastocatellia bacterium]|nr:ABC transporter ATP-binding protein [Blastocatellia bacterium]
MSGPFLRLVKVSKRYADRAVVSDVSLDVAEGEVMALLGASGSGKTTTLRIIAGLEASDAGEVWIGGEQVTADGRNIVPPSGRNIGFVFQDLALWPHLTVSESLHFVLASAGVPKAERAKRITEILELVRIGSFASSYPAQLSGGEQQRAAIARAIVSRPRLLLLDEPMSNLDASLKAELLDELAALQRLLNITTVYITHDRAEAGALAQRIAIMHGGRIEQVGLLDTLRTQPATEIVARLMSLNHNT